MKMVNGNAEAEENDYSLLKEWLPKNPCEDCYIVPGAQCSCPKMSDWDEKIERFIEAGIFDVKRKFQDLEEILISLKDIQERVREDMDFIQKSGFDLDKLFAIDKMDALSKLISLNCFSFTSEEVKEILSRDEEKVFRNSQLEQLRLGLEHGIDVSAYADLRFSGYQMEQIRIQLEKEKETEKEMEDLNV